MCISSLSSETCRAFWCSPLGRYTELKTLCLLWLVHPSYKARPQLVEPKAPSPAGLLALPRLQGALWLWHGKLKDCLKHLACCRMIAGFKRRYFKRCWRQSPMLACSACMAALQATELMHGVQAVYYTSLLQSSTDDKNTRLHEASSEHLEATAYFLKSSSSKPKTDSKSSSAARK